MELGDTHVHGIDVQTERMLPVLTLENTNIKLEPDFHTDDGTKLSENANYADIDSTGDVKTEVIDNGHNQRMDIHCNNDMGSNSNYTDSGMIRDAHVPHVKSAADDEPLENHDQNEFIFEIDTCKDEYYDAYRNNHGDVNLEEGGVEQEPGENCVTKDMHIMKHSDTQQQRRILHTSVDTKPCTVVVNDIRYTYPETVNHGHVLIHDAAPTVPLHTQPIYGNVSDKPPQKQFTCSECTAGFRKNSSLKTHMLIHTGEKPHTCSICEVSFSQKGGLTRHTRMHTGEKPYKCTVCGVGFAHTSHLKRHTMKHTGEKPHVCSVCGVGFTQKSDLRLHMRIHMSEKPHKCSVCDVSFARKQHLTAHIRTHTGEKPYKCSVCGVVFTQKCNMKTHMRIHTGEKPHKCSVCDVSFTRKELLTNHIRTHTGEKPYKCSVCGVGFAQKVSLETHTRTLHWGEASQMSSM